MTSTFAHPTPLLASPLPVMQQSPGRRPVACVPSRNIFKPCRQVEMLLFHALTNNCPKPGVLSRVAARGTSHVHLCSALSCVSIDYLACQRWGGGCLCCRKCGLVVVVVVAVV